MSRNYNNGSRDMVQAAKNALNAAADRREGGPQTAYDDALRFKQFAEFAREGYGVRYMEQITPEMLLDYGRDLAERVGEGDISAAYAQNLVSAVNSTIKIASRGKVDLGVGAVRDCSIPKKSGIRETPTIGQEKAAAGIQALRDQGMERQASVVELARDLGLRAKEVSLLNARTALRAAQKNGKISIAKGTKGGRPREMKITNQRQIQALKNAANVQGDGRSVIPKEMNYAQWKHGPLRDGREVIREATGEGYHNLRAEYAAQRYQQLTGHPPPCNGGGASKKDDRDARAIIAKELGHNRTDVTNTYLGRY